MITHVAIKQDGKIWSLPNPKRHHHIIALMISDRVNPYDSIQVQGFLTDTGEFLTREAAAKHAYDCDQVSTKFNKLNSEAIW